VGYNSRLDELQAAILRVLLRHLDAWSDGRRAGARAYLDAGLDDHVTVPVLPEGTVPAWHLYAVTHPRADELLQALAAAGVQARAYYRVPLHRQPAMAPFATGAVLPVTDELAATNIALPISPVLGPAQAREVVAAIAAAG
jgi:dTDP-4-amino-4,6-dideoxygalactose transaminase